VIEEDDGRRWPSLRGCKYDFDSTRWWSTPRAYCSGRRHNSGPKAATRTSKLSVKCLGALRCKWVSCCLVVRAEDMGTSKAEQRAPIERSGRGLMLSEASSPLKSSSRRYNLFQLLNKRLQSRRKRSNSSKWRWSCFFPVTSGLHFFWREQRRMRY